jgi:hypothetical protein
MLYDNFMSEIPNETKKILIAAFEIFDMIEKKKTVYKDNDLTSETHSNQYILLNEYDKICVSLFLAASIVESNMKCAMKSEGLFTDYIALYFNIDLTKTPYLLDARYKNIYYKHFARILFLFNNPSEFLNNYSSTVPLYNYVPELLILNLFSRQLCLSSIIEDCVPFMVLGYSDGKPEVIDSLFDKLKLNLIAQLEDFDNIYDEDNEYFTNRNYNQHRNIDHLPSDSYLRTYGYLLDEANYISDPAIGREKEIESLMLTLLTPEKSAILIGEAGIGKTAIVEGLMYRINNGNVPERLKDLSIVKLNVSSLLQGCNCRGDFEKRVENVVKELSEYPNIVLFIDEIHNIIGSGNGSTSPMDFANMLKPYLDRGQIKIVGATTANEYEAYIKPDTALKRRFEKITILEPTNDITFKILNGSIKKIEIITKTKFDFNKNDKNEILNQIIELTNENNRLLNDKLYNPDLALTILKKSFAYASLYNHLSVTIDDIINSINMTERIKQNAKARTINNLRMLFEEEVVSEEKPKRMVYDLRYKNGNYKALEVHKNEEFRV